MAGEKTEKATPKRKEDERKKGNVFMSNEVVTVFSLLAAFYGLQAFAPMIFTTLQESVSKYLSLGATQTQITVQDINRFFIDGCVVFAKTAVPLLLVCSLVAIILTLAQTKLMFSAKAFAFKANRLNPLSGLKKMFSMRGFIELMKSMLKIIVLMYVIYAALQKELATLPRLMDMSFMQAMMRTGQIIIDIALQAGMLFVFLAACDYLYQWWDYGKNLRMSKQEIKDEYKQTEGDPQIKGRMRSMQQQKSRKRMMQDVPKADVVIRNPTHYAVAIKYEQGKNSAPMVIAKGADKLALRIIKVAEDNNVYITEDRPLARALFESVEVDHEIPDKFYQAIAQVLAFVYSMRDHK